MTDPITIRASALSGYADCPRRSAARMFASLVRAMGYEIRRPPGSIGASVGSGTHAGAAALLTDKIEGRTPSLDQATNVAVETLRARIEEDEAAMDNATPSVAVAERQVIRMTKTYADFVAPDVQPQFVEQRLEAKVPFTTTPFVLSGQSDVLAREPDKLRDLKTGKIRMGNHMPQFGAYSLLARTHGRGVKAVVEDFVQRVPLQRPQPRPIQFKFDLQTCEMAAVAVLRQIDLNYQLFINGWPERGIQAGDPTAFPANPSSKLCDAKWCPAHGTKFCVEHRTDDREPEPTPQPETTDIPEFLK
jgi:hypothetical protein